MTEKIDSDEKLVSKAWEVLNEMKSTEGFAFTEDSYTARIPGKRLADWYETLHTVLFRLRSEIDI
ncbi:MAG: hypothetical protein WC935_00330 [Thermoleophilia bacterium]